MRKIYFLVLLGIFSTSPLFAAYEEPQVDLERIVVTPNRTEEEADDVPQAVTVITSQDIADSNAPTVIGVLSYQPGVYARDYYGNGTRASVDIRGFGETAPNNVLVLIDGRRINEIDLSGADWTQIPVDQIERIEITRGGSSVLYGDNAFGGVINIITKTGTGKPKISIGAQLGSYDLSKENLGLSGAKDKLSYNFNFTNHQISGYRQNSFYHGYDLGTKLGYDLTPSTKLQLSGGYHEARFGLPGSLSEKDLNTSYSRRDSKFPNDHVGETDGFADFEVKNKLNEENELSTAFSFRQRRVTDQLYSSFYVDNRQINTISVRPKYTLSKDLLGHKNNLIAGFDFYSYKTIVDEYGSDGVAKTRRSAINRLTNAIYLQNDFYVTPKLLFSAGARNDQSQTIFDSTPLPGDSSGTFVHDAAKVKEDVYKTGLNYNYKPDSKVYANFSRNFRLPATSSFLRFDVTTQSLLPNPKTLFEVPIGPLIAAFLFLSALAHLLISLPCFHPLRIH